MLASLLRSSLRSLAASLARRLPMLRDAVAERDALRARLEALTKDLRFVPPGHFYSPIPSLDEVRRDEARIFGSVPHAIPGVELREAAQRALLESFVAFYDELPFHAQKREGLRYHYENPAYSYSDAIMLYCMIRHLRPARIIEVGSGHSSCVMLDVNERHFGGSIATTFIEPHPELLLSLLKDGDRDAIRLIPARLQEVDLAGFGALQANDILFIDSTHVSKIDSDVNRIVFDILPRLASGVHVHFHDVAWPFEYSKQWVYEGRAWNEAYVLRAFLQYNGAFEVVLMNTYMAQFHEAFFRERMPLCLKNRGGSLWLRRV